jgi:ubiquinol-cytochrome c reductase iron-sulfur subunit
MNRRNVLAGFLSALAAVSAYAASVPFVRSFVPSARARAKGNPIEVDLSTFRPGEVRPYEYRGRVMLVLRRTAEMLGKLDVMSARRHDRDTLDPPYAASPHRSINPEFLVVEGVCPHLGCVPQVRGQAEGKELVGDWWRGGLICPCHVSAFDYTGRVVKGPAPENLRVPPHRYLSPTRIVIGEEDAPT